MRRRVLLLGVLAALLALAMVPAIALATHSPSDNPRQDFAVGGGSLSNVGFDLRFAFSGHSGPLVGENPVGHVTLKETNVITQGQVECVAVSGNQAVVGIDDPRSEDPDVGIYIIVKDNGHSSSVPDEANVSRGGNLPPSLGFCAVLLASNVQTAPLKGEAVVHDALTVP